MIATKLPIAWAKNLSVQVVLFRPRPSPAVRFLSISSTERVRRSLLSVPGSDQRKIDKALNLKADSIVLDLEDGVAWDKKDQARTLVTQTLQHMPSSTDAEICVRINALNTGQLALQDLLAVLQVSKPTLRAIVVPKVERASDIDFIQRLVQMHSSGHRIRILAAIESAVGMSNIQEIAATAATTSLDALIFASEDYCADLELIRTESATELLYARSQLVTAAKAHQLQAIDMVHIDFKNLEALRTECRRGLELGFTGKQAIHPSQLDTIHQTFQPSAKDVAFAQECKDLYESAADAGRGACVVQGIVVDAPVYKHALKVLQRAQRAGILEK
jgi:citrate lyase subunit beta-like protein